MGNAVFPAEAGQKGVLNKFLISRIKYAECVPNYHERHKYVLVTTAKHEIYCGNQNVFMALMIFKLKKD